MHWLERAHPTRLLDALRSGGCTSALSNAAGESARRWFGEWIVDRSRARAAVEDEIAVELGLVKGEVLLDFPIKTEMLGLDIPVLRRDGQVEQLTAAGWPGSINLPTLSEELYLRALDAGVRVPQVDRSPRGHRASRDPAGRRGQEQAGARRNSVVLSAVIPHEHGECRDLLSLQRECPHTAESRSRHSLATLAPAGRHGQDGWSLFCRP